MSSFENFVKCRVVSPVVAAATDIALYEAVAPFNLPPEEGGILVLTDSPNNPSVIEVIRYGYRNALGLYDVQRGQEGTTSIAWTGPVYCYQSLMAGDFQALLDSKVDKAAGESLMLDAERTKLAGIQAGAQANSVTSVAGRTGAVTLAKADVGLGNVDNTSDANKPVSTAQQAALNAKAPLASPALTGTPTAPTPAAGTNTTQIANAAFVQSALAALVASSPAALDTLNELAAALGNDPNFAATMTNALANKVDKVAGKQLSTEDFTAALLTKLNGIAASATKNATDAQLRDRLTHTGTQAIGTVTGLQEELDARPLTSVLTAASPSILIVDQLRRSVEAATGGRQTVLYTAKSQPNLMYVLPRFNCEDVAPGGELGTGTHPAFLFNGVAAQEIFVGAHLASEIAGEAVSRPFVDPRHSLNFDQSRALCQANGPGWDLMSNLDWAAITLWCMANGYEPLGNTNYGRHHAKRWETARRVDTLAPGDTAGTGRTLAGSGPASWAHDGTPAGIQDMVGNVWEWVSGMKMVNGRARLAPDNGQLAESQFIDSGFDLPTSRTFSTVSATGANNLVKQSLIAPAATALAPQGYLYTTLTDERLPIRGGAWTSASSAGLGALSLDHARTGANSGFGFRPRFRAL